MHREIKRSVLTLTAMALSARAAFAHHVMGGRMAATFGEGLLSGLGYPIIPGA
jgi:urease accessory protein